MLYYYYYYYYYHFFLKLAQNCLRSDHPIKHVP